MSPFPDTVLFCNHTFQLMKVVNCVTENMVILGACSNFWELKNQSSMYIFLVYEARKISPLKPLIHGAYACFGGLWEVV